MDQPLSRGRPRIDGSHKAERIHFTATKGFRDRLKAYSDRVGLPVAEILRQAAEEVMDKEKETK